MQKTAALPNNHRLQIIALAYITFIALGLPSGALGVAWPSIRDAFQVTDAEFGILLIPVTIGYLSASVLSGPTVTRLGIGLTMIVASFISMLGIVGYGLAESWWILVGFGLIFGLGQGIVDSGLNLYFAHNFSPRLMNWLHASFGLGAALGPLVMTRLIALDLSWRWGYIIFAILQLVLALSFLLTRRFWIIQSSDVVQDDTEAAAPPLQTSIQQPLVLISVLLFFIFTGIETIAGNWGFTLLTESRAVDAITAGEWVSLYWWSFTLGRIAFGFVADHLPANKSIQACLLLVLVGGGLLTINVNHAVSFIGLVLMGFSLAPIFPLLITTTPKRLGIHATNAIGFQIGAAGLSLAALPAVAGVLATRTSLEIIGPYLMIATILAFICFQLLNAWTTSGR